MLKFKALELADQEQFLDYLENYPFNTYEYSFLTLYLWRKYGNVQYAISGKTLIIKKNEDKKGTYFMQPIGYSEGELEEIIKELVKVKLKEKSCNYLFRDIEEPFVQQLKEIYGDRMIVIEDANNFDYIYETQHLINLAGEKLHKKKNLYNQFIKGYQYEIKDIRDQGVAEDCLKFSQLWYESQKVKYKEFVFELEGLQAVLNHLDELKAIGMAVYVDNRVVGFTIGEKVNKHMAVIHVEKGDTTYKGIYAFINKTFAEQYLKEIPYINREEDLGMVKLRKAKEAYNPLKLEKKYIVDIV